jgi:simple sugar transport system permease protein
MTQSVVDQTHESAAQQSVPSRRGARGVLLNSVRELALLPAIVAIIVAGTIVSPVFFTTGNLINVLEISAALGAVVVAESLVLLIGDLDLSLQSVYGLAPMVAAWLIVPKSQVGLGTDIAPALGILVLLGVGLAIGLFNGVMIVKGGFNSFIFTLAMLILLAGVQQGIVSGNTIFEMPASFVYLGSAAWLGVPVSAWVSGAIFLAAGLFLRYHRTGRAIYAIGGNLEAARAAGVKVDRIRIGVFAIAGLLASVAGLMTAGHVDAVTANQGNNLIFTVFAAAVIGGISLDGGRGRMLGAFTGVLLLGLVQNVLVLSQVDTFWISAADGAIILIALLLARVVQVSRT